MKKNEEKKYEEMEVGNQGEKCRKNMKKNKDRNMLKNNEKNMKEYKRENGEKNVGKI